MAPLSTAQPASPSPTTDIDSIGTVTMPSTAYAPPSPPASPTFNLRNAKVSHYTKPTTPPRFPRHPCPTSHYTLSLLSSEHEAQRLFGASFTLRSPTTGELLGPFALLSYTDAWIPKYCRYIHSVVSTPVFTLRERELIILAVASITQADYVVYEHRRIARSVGLSEDMVESALDGVGWMEMLHLSAREKNVYRLSSEMAGSWGRVGEETWQDVVVKDKPKARGQEGWLDKEIDVGEDVEMVGEDDHEEVDGGTESGVKSGAGKKTTDKEGKPERLTREETATLAQMLASTMFVSVLVNCAEVEVPKTEAEIVQQP